MRNMNQQELGDALNVAQQTVSRYENGQNRPELETLIQIADLFNVPLDFVVDRKWPAEDFPDIIYDTADIEDDRSVISDKKRSEELIREEARRIVSVYKASEAFALDSLDLSRLTLEQKDIMQKLYNIFLGVQESGSVK